MKVKPKPLASRLFANLPYKLLSLVIACVIWYIVQGEEILEINRKLDVTFEVPQGLAIREGHNISRDVTLRGPRVALSDFSSKPIQATIRLPNGKKGSQRYRIDKEMISHWDNRIKITVHDPFVTIFVDDRASRSVPVKVTILGTPKPGVSIREVRAEPAEVTVTGLKSDLQKLQDVATEVLDIGGLSESKSFPVPLSLAGLPAFELSTQQVVVKINVYEGMISKVLADVVVDAVGTERLSRVQPQQVGVILQGPAAEVERLTSKDIQVTVDANDLGPGRYERDLVIKVPHAEISATAQPAKVWLEIYNQKKLR